MSQTFRRRFADPFGALAKAVAFKQDSSLRRFGAYIGSAVTSADKVNDFYLNLVNPDLYFRISYVKTRT